MSNTIYNPVVFDAFTNLEAAVQEDIEKDLWGNITYTGFLGGGNGMLYSKDAIGTYLEQILIDWFKRNKYNIFANPHTQQYPDAFVLNALTQQIMGGLEFKGFDYTSGGTGWDFSYYKTFIRHVVSEMQGKTPITDYLATGYEMKPDGRIRIQKVFLKHIWEMCGPSRKHPISNKQSKGGKGTQCIIPVNLIAKNPIMKPFNSFNEFWNAILETHLIVYGEPLDISAVYDDEYWKRLYAK